MPTSEASNLTSGLNCTLEAGVPSSLERLKRESYLCRHLGHPHLQGHKLLSPSINRHRSAQVTNLKVNRVKYSQFNSTNLSFKTEEIAIRTSLIAGTPLTQLSVIKSFVPITSFLSTPLHLDCREARQ